MDIPIERLIAVVDRAAEGSTNGEAVAQNVLIAIRDLDESVQEVVVNAVADGLGVSLV